MRRKEKILSPQNNGCVAMSSGSTISKVIIVDTPKVDKTIPENPMFDGADYIPIRDNARLTGQIKRIYSLMSDGKWRTLQEIEQETGDPQASISAQLRHLRKARFGGYTVGREHLGGGLYRYRLGEQ